MISLLINNGSTLKYTLPQSSNIPTATDILLPTVNINNYAVQGQI